MSLLTEQQREYMDHLRRKKQGDNSPPPGLLTPEIKKYIQQDEESEKWVAAYMENIPPGVPWS